jgi:hypothetical protein
MPKVYRDRPVVSTTLSPEAVAVFDELALRRGLTRSTFLELLLREEAIRSRLDIYKLGSRERKKRGITKTARRPAGDES